MTVQALGAECGIWAAVPYKGRVGTKRRLAALLDPSERARVSRAMLADVLQALLDVPVIARVLLLTPAGSAVGGAAGASLTDTAGDAVPDDPRLTLLHEPHPVAGANGAAGLNPALQQAQAAAVAGGARCLLIVPADLPLLQSSDVAALLQATWRLGSVATGSPPAGGMAGDADGPADAAGVVIAPDRAAGGTNALLLSPPDLFAPAFGVDSFLRHRALAAQAGRPCVVVERPGLALDLDTPADVQALLASGHDGRVVRLLRHLGGLDRLALLQARSATI